MNPIDVLRQRRSIRKFKNKEIPWDNIVSMIHSAVNAPVAGNIANIKYILIREPSAKKEVSKACLDQAWLTTAPLLIAITAEPEQQKRYYGSRGEKLFTIQNAAAAAMNIITAAEFLGLGSCWVGSFNEDELRNVLVIPEHVNIHAIIALGFPDESPPRPPKPAVNTVVYLEKWWSKRKFPGYGFYSENVVKTAKKAGDAIKDLSEKLLGKKK